MSKPRTYTQFQIGECICGREFISCVLTRRKYCSKRCAQDAKNACETRARVRDNTKPKISAIAIRICLRCSQPFESVGPQNRICKVCAPLVRAIANTCIVLGSREAL